jgi:hypothetical protein
LEQAFVEVVALHYRWNCRHVRYLAKLFQMTPNHAASGNGSMTLLLDGGHYRRAMPAQRRWVLQ